MASSFLFYDLNHRFNHHEPDLNLFGLSKQYYEQRRTGFGYHWHRLDPELNVVNNVAWLGA
jgi:hypothetical protein